MSARFGMAAVLILGCMNAPSHSQTAAAQVAEKDSVVHFRLRDNYKVIVPVSVNGLEPANFVLDTGTKTTMIDERIGRELRLNSVAYMPITTLTGTRTVPISRFDNLSMGKVSAQGLEASIVDLREAFSVDSDIYGVLGQDFLVRLNYLLDYRAKRIVLEDRGDLQRDLRGDQVPLELRESRDHVHCSPGHSVQQQIHFMLDSGAPFAVVFDDSQVCSILQVQRDGGRTVFSGAFGSRSAERGSISIFRIGNKTLGNLSVRLTPIRQSEHRWENGLLPTSLFQAIYFNHEAGYVILNPRIPAEAAWNHR